MPPEITISLADYDAYRAAAFQAWDAHVMLRKLDRLVLGAPLSEVELEEIRMEYMHFKVYFLPAEG